MKLHLSTLAKVEWDGASSTEEIEKAEPAFFHTQMQPGQRSGKADRIATKLRRPEYFETALGWSWQLAPQQASATSEPPYAKLGARSGTRRCDCIDLHLPSRADRLIPGYELGFGQICLVTSQRQDSCIVFQRQIPELCSFAS